MSLELSASKCGRPADEGQLDEQVSMVSGKRTVESQTAGSMADRLNAIRVHRHAGSVASDALPQT